MNIDAIDNLPRRLAERLRRPLPGRLAQARFSPELSYGRQFGPRAHDVRPAAVIVLLYQHENAWHIPLTLRPAGMTDHGGQVSLPGGLVEADETSREAALRELHEELGVPPDGIEVLNPLSPIYVFVSNHWVTPWVATISKRPSIRPNRAEVAEVLEVPLAMLLDSANRSRHQIRRHGLTFSAPHISWRTHRIWGATGMMLGEFIAVIDELDDT